MRVDQDVQALNRQPLGLLGVTSKQIRYRRILLRELTNILSRQASVAVLVYHSLNRFSPLDSKGCTFQEILLRCSPVQIHGPPRRSFR
jgi:hypothetical protein